MASRDEEKAAANLLRRSLHDSDDVCPGPDILAAYFERSLDRQQSARYELHLSQCARCREGLAALDRVGASAAPSQPFSYWAWLWDWRRLAPVAAALIIAAVWMARRPAPKPTSEPPPLVALSRSREVPPTSPEPPARSIPSGIPRVNPATNLTSDFGRAEKPQAGKEKKEAVADLDAEVSKPVSRNAAASVMPGGNAGNVAAPSGAARIASEPSTMEMKGQQTSAAARAPARAAKTDTGLRSQAVTLEAVAHRSTGEMVATPDPKVLWRIADGGLVERSQDGGVSWQGQLPDAGTQLTAGSAPSENICWFVGPGSVIVLTTNAKDWKRISPPVSADFVAITAEDASTATVTTADGRKFTTGDGGVHWSPTL
jgi:hypothetical protein